MSRYLTRVTEVIRVDKESEAKLVIEEAQKDSSFMLVKHSSEYKERKSKGEVIDSWYKVTLLKEFNNEKEPTSYVKVTYDVEPGYFPSPMDDYEE